MNEAPYIVYSFRMLAWVTNSSGTSDYRQAKIFTRPAALAYCKNLRDYTGAPGAIPVLFADVEGVNE